MCHRDGFALGAIAIVQIKNSTTGRDSYDYAYKAILVAPTSHFTKKKTEVKPQEQITKKRKKVHIVIFVSMYLTSSYKVKTIV